MEQDDVKVCIDCKKQIEYLCDFPGPRCLECHAKKWDKLPLEKPDFKRAINLGGKKKL